MKTWPTLYKKTSTGKIQFWTIEADDDLETDWPGEDPETGELNPFCDICPGIIVMYGQVDGKEQQTCEFFREGKNIGKKNETTAFQQAIAEAQARWEKQKKKGYVESIEAAQADKTDALIEGGINPMLAHKFLDHSHKIIYPAYVQPKLDGIRCIAIIKDGKCTLWSRTRKPIMSMPHIIEALESISPDLNMILDGELYNVNFKDNFEHIVSLVRQEEPDPRHKDVEYHVYDICIEDKPFNSRSSILNHMPKRPHIIKVQTSMVLNEIETMYLFEEWRSQGYEGAMIRNSESLYENKRSYGLQKIKEFQDDEFDIIGIEEGRGKLAGHVGAFVCKTSDGKEFMAKMAGETEKLKEYFQNHRLWQNKKLTIKYQGFTSYKIPRFPIGKAIRDYE